jgi:predicted nucleotidyltransferase
MEQPEKLDPNLQEIVNRLLEVGKPQNIVLFGSQARGETGGGSNYDLLVVESSMAPRFRRATRYRRTLKDFGHSKYIVVWTPDEVAECQNVSHAFVTTALREGIILYDG